MNKVAVVMPVYNTEKYLQKCLNSLNNQDYKDFTIFAVNNCSTDNSLELLKDNAIKYKNIIILEETKQGVSYARNRALIAIENSNQYKYICFVDSDDEVCANFISNNIKLMRKFELDYIVCGWQMFNICGCINGNDSYGFELMDNTNILLHYFVSERYKKSGTISLSLLNKIFKADCIKGVRFDVGLKHSEDVKFFLDCADKLKRGGVNERLLYFYRLRKSSLSHSNNTYFNLANIYIGALNKYKENNIIKRTIQIKLVELFWKSLNFNPSSSYLKFVSRHSRIIFSDLKLNCDKKMFKRLLILSAPFLVVRFISIVKSINSLKRLKKNLHFYFE